MPLRETVPVEFLRREPQKHLSTAQGVRCETAFLDDAVMEEVAAGHARTNERGGERNIDPFPPKTRQSCPLRKAVGERAARRIAEAFTHRRYAAHGDTD